MQQAGTFTTGKVPPVRGSIRICRYNGSRESTMAYGWSLKLQRYMFTIQHRKGSLNIVPDALSRCFVEEIGIEEDFNLEIDLNHPSFQGEEYLSFIEIVNKNKESLPDLMTSENFVYKRTGFRTGNVDDDLKTWKLWVPSDLRINLISSAQDPKTKAHGGISKTLYSIRQRFYWPQMAIDVKLYINNCESCKCSKSSNTTLRPEMGKIIEATKPFQHVFVDLLGPYPRSKYGNTKINICLDQLTKAFFKEPIPKSSIKIIIDILSRRIFSIFGCPESLLSDRGTEFLSNLFESFLEKLKIRLLRTAKHSSQTNASERVNRSVLDSIRSYIDSDHIKWDENLNEIASALRSSYHQTIKMSPFEALLGYPIIHNGSECELLRKL